MWSPLKRALCVLSFQSNTLSEMDTQRRQRWWPTGTHLAEFYTHTDLLQSSKCYIDLCSSIARQAWLPNENKGCMYSADTHHQSQIACSHDDYLLYVNPMSNKAGYPPYETLLLLSETGYHWQVPLANCSQTDYVPLRLGGKIGKGWYQEVSLRSSTGRINEGCASSPYFFSKGKDLTSSGYFTGQTKDNCTSYPVLYIQDSTVT